MLCGSHCGRLPSPKPVPSGTRGECHLLLFAARSVKALRRCTCLLRGGQPFCCADSERLGHGAGQRAAQRPELAVTQANLSIIWQRARKARAIRGNSLGCRAGAYHLARVPARLWKSHPAWTAHAVSNSANPQKHPGGSASAAASGSREHHCDRVQLIVCSPRARGVWPRMFSRGACACQWIHGSSAGQRLSGAMLHGPGLYYNVTVLQLSRRYKSCQCSHCHHANSLLWHFFKVGAR